MQRFANRHRHGGEPVQPSHAFDYAALKAPLRIPLTEQLPLIIWEAAARPWTRLRRRQKRRAAQQRPTGAARRQRRQEIHSM